MTDWLIFYLNYSLDRGILEDIFQQTRLLKLEKKVMIIKRMYSVKVSGLDDVMKWKLLHAMKRSVLKNFMKDNFKI